MKYFTFDWWSGEPNSDPCHDYNMYIQSIKSALPAELCKFIDLISVHDGHIRHIQLDTANKSLLIRIDTDDGHGDLQVLELEYLHVSQFESISNPAAGLPGPHGYGDIGYDEFELHSNGDLEHCMLMSTNIEIYVIFRGFHYQAAA